MNRILYLHGFASSPASSKARFFAARLRAAGARVDIPDLAAGDFEHLTITGQLRVIEQAAAGEPVALMGSSMGGYLAALYAARHPEVSRVVLTRARLPLRAAAGPERMGADAVAAWRATGSMRGLPLRRQPPAQPARSALLDDGLRYEDYPISASPR